MKINPIGINAYQQVARTGNAVQKPNAGGQSVESTNVRIRPQNSNLPSKISVKPQLAEPLSTMSSAERNALESLLKVVQEKGSMNAGYARDNREQENPEAIGNFVDVKV